MLILLKLFSQAHHVILPVKPNEYHLLSMRVVADVIQKNNACIASVEFIGIDSSQVKSRDVFLKHSEKEGFWFYFSNFHAGDYFKKMIKVPDKCYAIRLKLKKWAGEGEIFFDGNINIEKINAKRYKNLFRSLVLNRIGNNEEKSIRDRHLWLDNKKNAYEFVRRYHVDAPAIYKEFPGIDAINLCSHPDSFVLKPLWGHSSKGVFVLHKIPGEKWYDSMRGKEYFLEQILEEIESELGGKAKTSMFFTEEYMEDANGFEIPLDYKIYSFFGRVGMVMQKHVPSNNDASTWRFKFYDADWNDLGPVKYHNRIDSTLPIPLGFKEILKSAEILSLNSNVPFLRIDFYATKNGIKFGEFTPMPGGFDEHNFDTDEMLGKMWSNAQAEINKRTA